MKKILIINNCNDCPYCKKEDGYRFCSIAKHIDLFEGLPEDTRLMSEEELRIFENRQQYNLDIQQTFSDKVNPLCPLDDYV
jgi:hypothetical protein